MIEPKFITFDQWFELNKDDLQEVCKDCNDGIKCNGRIFPCSYLSDYYESKKKRDMIKWEGHFQC